MRAPPDHTGAKSVAQIAAFIGNRPREKILSPIWFAFYDEDEDEQGAPLPPPLKPSRDFNDLLTKARAGDVAALKRYATHARAVVRELELLERKNPALVKSVPCEFSDWPVVVSPSGPRVGEMGGAVGALLKRLDVGGNSAPLPAYSTQKNDPEKNLWAKYALNAHICLRSNRQLMPYLASKCRTATRRMNMQYRRFKTVHKVAFFEVGDEIVHVEEWQKRCLDLPDRVTEANSHEFMALAKYAIREFWYVHPRHFDEVKKKAATLVRYETTGEYVSRALDKIGQTLREMAHKF